MIKFSEFLTEKVSKKEIEDVLKNKNIMVGIEYEIKLNDVNLASLISDDVIDGWDKLKDDIENFVDDVNQITQKYFDYIETEVDKAISILSDDIDKLEDSIDSMERQVDEKADAYDKLDEEIVNLKTQLLNINDPKERKKIEDVIKKKETEKGNIDKEIDKLNETIDELDMKIYDKKDILSDLRSYNRDNYFEIIEILVEHFGYDMDELDFNAYLSENLITSFPETTNDLYGFFAEHGIYDVDRNIASVLENEIYIVLPLEDIDVDNVMYKLSVDGILDPEDYIEDDALSFDDISSLDIWDDAPFDVNDADVGEYHNSSDYTRWRIEEDYSVPIKEGGIEIISPVKPIADTVKDLKQMLAFIRKHGYTDSDTGLHVNMSYKGKTFKDADFLKLILFMSDNEKSLYKLFPERKGNYYTKSVDSVISSFSSHINNKGKIQQAISEFAPNRDKMFGVNLSHAYDDPSGRIEFRYLGGKDYEKKYQEIVAQIGRYATYIMLMFDKNYRKNEYYKKAAKLMDKVYGHETQDKLEVKEIKNILKNGKIIPPDNMRIVKYRYRGYIYTVDSVKQRIISVLPFTPIKKSEIKKMRQKGKPNAKHEIVYDDTEENIRYIIAPKSNSILRYEQIDKKNPTIKKLREYGVFMPPPNNNITVKYKGLLYTISPQKDRVIKTEKVR